MAKNITKRCKHLKAYLLQDNSIIKKTVSKEIIDDIKPVRKSKAIKKNVTTEDNNTDKIVSNE